MVFGVQLAVTTIIVKYTEHLAHVGYFADYLTVSTTLVT